MSESSAISPVLDLLIAFTQSDAAHLYQRDPATFELRLIGARPRPEDGRISRISPQFPALVEPAIFCAGDPGFDGFPETLVTQAVSLLATPIRAPEDFVGVLTLCRKHPRAYGSREIEGARKAGEALAAVVKSHRENLLLERRLAERKLLERAKGLLQVHYGWTEEDAYYHIRRTSRQQRTPMAVIAQRVIDVAAAKEVEAERMSA